MDREFEKIKIYETNGDKSYFKLVKLEPKNILGYHDSSDTISIFSVTGEIRYFKFCGKEEGE